MCNDVSSGSGYGAEKWIGSCPCNGSDSDCAVVDTNWTFSTPEEPEPQHDRTEDGK